ncbi:MAG: AI-2E family transporter [Bacteroidales bacterium]|jgi:predicted PurR-regulated permease PerM|nr:AI-2E family transporter [Bacteroidales bacterium]
MEDNKKFQFPTIAKWIASVAVVVLVVWLIWYFRFLVGCLFAAIVISFMGRPLKNLISKIHYKRLRIGNSVSTGVSLLLVLGIFFLVFYFLVPLIISQAMAFSNLDIYTIADYYAEPIRSAENFLREYQLMHDNTSLTDMVSAKIMSLFTMFNLTDVANWLLTASSNFLMGVFIVVFFAFFFLKDSHLLVNFIDAVTPDKHLNEVHNIMNSSRNLISRYFIGIFLEIISMIVLLIVGFYCVGFSNVVLIACFCGAFVILPYIGVFIGGIIGLMICLTSFLSQDPNINIAPIVMKFLIVFASVKIIDDFVLQPLIYSRSVKAHPLEVFIVILVAGQIAGIAGMILAIPVYTFLRIIAKEFFSKWKFVRKITQDL